jgi:uncharacterized protein (PEP-CTERM system associated)
MLRSAAEIGGAPPGGESSGVVSTSDPFENTYATLAWNFSRNRTGLSLSVGYSDDAYETQTLLDRTTLSYNASIERQLSARWSASLAGTLTEEDFDNADVTDDTMELVATISCQVGRSLALRLELQRFDRDSSNGLGEYVENRAFLTLEYRGATRGGPRGAPRGGRTPR